MKNDFNRAMSAKTKSMFKALEQNDEAWLLNVLKEGADANAVTKTPGFFMNLVYETPYAPQSSPLHLAALAGNRLSVLYLIRYGADVNAVNAEGQTPLDYALTNLKYYEEKKASPKKILGISFKANAAKTNTKIRRYELVIRDLLKAGATPGLFRLPEKFKKDGFGF